MVFAKFLRWIDVMGTPPCNRESHNCSNQYLTISFLGVLSTQYHRGVDYAQRWVPTDDVKDGIEHLSRDIGVGRMVIEFVGSTNKLGVPA